MTRALACIALGLATACATTSQVSPAGVEGTYALVEVDGEPLSPETQAEPGYILDAASITLAPAGRFTLYLRARQVSTSQSVERTLGGSYTVAGSIITMRPDDAADAAGAPEPLNLEPGGRLVGRSAGRSMVFQRR